MNQEVNAYHKGPCLAVLHEGTAESVELATRELDKWCEDLLDADCSIKEYAERNTMTAFLGGGAVVLKCVVTPPRKESA